MTDRPIIFSAPMVRALIEGRKTQTRRVLCQFDPERDPPSAGPYFAGHKAATWTDSEGTPWRYPGAKGAATGDRLYVRESLKRQETDQGVGYQTFAADGRNVWPLTTWHHLRPSIPSIHMPRWASRLTLTVTDVRVQRLQDISEADAWDEGCKPGALNDRGEPFPAEEPHPKGGSIGWDCAVDWYADLWNSLHGPDAWDANPWVVAVSFTVEQRNIDAGGGNA